MRLVEPSKPVEHLSRRSRSFGRPTWEGRRPPVIFEDGLRVEQITGGGLAGTERTSFLFRVGSLHHWRPRRAGPALGSSVWTGTRLLRRGQSAAFIVMISVVMTASQWVVRGLADESARAAVIPRQRVAGRREERDGHDRHREIGGDTRKKGNVLHRVGSSRKPKAGPHQRVPAEFVVPKVVLHQIARALAPLDSTD